MKQRSLMAALALSCASACTCGASHTVDAGADAGVSLPDAGGVDAGAPAVDANVPPLPPGACEDVFSGMASHACAPDATLYCGLERCCFLQAGCVDGMLERGLESCSAEPVEPTCALAAPNARVRVTVDGTTYSLDFAHADHGVGFATYVDLTFLPDGDANVCSAQRLGIEGISPDFASMPDAPAYDGVHELRFQWTDETASPRYRFFSGQLTITGSLPFRSGGPVSGSLSADDEGIEVSGTFEAPECEPWRTSGS